MRCDAGNGATFSYALQDEKSGYEVYLPDPLCQTMLPNWFLNITFFNIFRQANFFGSQHWL
jgi:hypothetical protein